MKRDYMKEELDHFNEDQLRDLKVKMKEEIENLKPVTVKIRESIIQDIERVLEDRRSKGGVRQDKI